MAASDKNPGTELATFDPSSSAFPILFDQGGETGIAQVLADNFGDDGFSAGDLDRVTVPSGGGLAWDIPDEDPERYIEGVIVHKQPTRSFWFKKRGEDGEEDGPPDCASADAKIGIGVFGAGSQANPTGECANCPMNVFGSSTSGSGNGKACKEQMQVFLLQPGSVLPLQVTLPPTSLRGFRKYMTRLASKAVPFYAVTTKFGLKVEKGGGQTYSVVIPEKGETLRPEEAAAARSYGVTIKNTFEAQRIAWEAAKAAEAGTAPVPPEGGGAGWPAEDEAPSGADSGAQTSADVRADAPADAKV